MNFLHDFKHYPFRFHPIYKEFLWGGEHIKACFQREAVPNGKVAESWEVVDHENEVSLIANGFFSGKSLHDIVASQPEGIFGVATHPLDRFGRFPLILKYIDADGMVPVQVHPQVQKTWIVVEAAPESVMYLGFNRHYSQADVVAAIQEGRIESLLHRIQPKVGDCYLIEPGTVHSLGNEILVAEVQQTGDNFLPLPIEQALQAINYQQEAVFPQKPSPTGYRDCKRLVMSDELMLNRWSFGETAVWASDNRCHIWSVLQGSVTAIFHLGRRGTPESFSGRQSDPILMECLKPGDTLLVPGACRSIQWTNDGDATVILLDAYV